MVRVLGDIFEKEAAHIAMIYKDKKINYAELQKNVDKYAVYLKQLGVRKGDCVALSCQNSPEFVYSYFGVTQAGATVIPMNLMLTLKEIEYIFSDAKVKTWIIHRNIFEKINIPEEKVIAALDLETLIVVDEEFTDSIASNKQALEVQMYEDDVCTILYTSGTTGKPKGVMLTHKNLLSNADSLIELFHVNQEDKFLCVLPFFHTFGFTVTILAPLLAGATLVISETFNPKEVINNLNEEKITIFSGVPSMYVLLCKHIQKHKLKFPHIRHGVSAGASLPMEIGRAFLDIFPIAEGYGLTETAPTVTVNCSNDVNKLGSVGLPIPGVEVKIVDDRGKALPTGIVGELVVKGPNVMKGYLNQPEATEEALVNGWLYTGDLARVDKDGFIYIVDRKKDLIITSGLNVYPREVEEVIYEHPDVFECAVVGVDEGTRGEVVKAFIVPKEEKTITKEDMLGFLKDKLASYKVPRIIEFTDSLPKNATGKILKRKIKDVG
ncbi:o-succinylbenzoate--CoA ligase [Bacillus sp. 165]|uniref:o-succinylbenzoate--CoA ligase n=1 Tax=Bacillus sp. 165 TaxID=1529117 RepID=UPI001ADA53F3|nr:o-succinylbenzoate--CoA ligase [Bacillus sp. 165]MBO9129273.1 o-succinylbenzoate--CoA ligase [Bacillus sp. 165]